MRVLLVLAGLLAITSAQNEGIGPACAPTYDCPGGCLRPAGPEGGCPQCGPCSNGGVNISPSCPEVFCSAQCPRVIGANGCPECGPCSNGGANISPSCPEISCPPQCPRVIGANDCPECGPCTGEVGGGGIGPVCRPAPCPVTCRQGTDANNCPTCQCATNSYPSPPGPECPPAGPCSQPQCSLITGQDGCPRCDCSIGPVTGISTGY